MPRSAVDLCSAAMRRLGAGPITSFTDNTAEAEVAAELYPIVLDEVLTSFYWSFARRQADLVQSVTDPIADFDYKYELPVDFLRAERLGDAKTGGHLWPYRLMDGRSLHTNAKPAILTYTGAVADASWPAYFEPVLLGRLAAEFCMPITEDERRAQLWDQRYERALARGRLMDSQQDTPEAFGEFPLDQVR